MAFPCLPPSTQQERELMQVNKHLNDRIATLEASLAASEQCERELTELNQSLQAELTAAEEAAIRRCAAWHESQVERYGAHIAEAAAKDWVVSEKYYRNLYLIHRDCATHFLALIPPKAEL